MSYIAMNVAFACCLVLSCFICESCSQQPYAIRRMEMCVEQFTSVSLVAQQPEDVLDNCSRKRWVIIDSAYLNRINHYLEQFPHCDAYLPGYVDARIVCLVYRNADTPDTLAFGRGSMSYRDHCCIADTVFLRTIIDSLGKGYAADYDWYVHGYPPRK